MNGAAPPAKNDETAGDAPVPLTDVLQRIASEADHQGIVIADHAVPAVRREGIGVGIDPAAWLAHGQDPVPAVFAENARLVSARLCDLLATGLRGPAGDHHHGRLDVMTYQAALAAVGYRRPIVVDARQWNDPWHGLQQSAQAWEHAVESA